MKTMMRFSPPGRERGAALLTVLLLVAVMAVIAATALDRLKISTRLAGNGSAMVQARAYSYAAEELAASRIEDIVSRDAAQLTLAGEWLDMEIPVPVDGGVASLRLSDASNCFNVNSLVTQGDTGFAANPVGMVQFRRLMQLLDIDDNSAFVIAESAVDWIDSDNVVLANGAEDSYYRGLETPYLPANRLMADTSELLAVKGVTPGIYRQMSDYLCALPIAETSVINVNTLAPERAVLLSMLFDGALPVTRARAYLANRPEDGYGSLVRFWNAPLLAEFDASPATKAQVSLQSDWFGLESNIAVGDIRLKGRALISVRQGSAGIEWRSWDAAG